MNTKLKAILLLCALSGSALNFSVFAQNKVVTSSTTESGQSYHDVSNNAALSVRGEGVAYNGTDITLSATFNGSSSGDDIEIGGRGVYAGSGATLLLTGGSISTTGSYGYGAWIDRSGTGTLNNVNVVTQAERGYGVFVRGTSNLMLTGGSISTIGIRAYGVRLALESTGTVSNTTISTQGGNAYGVSVENASNLTLTDSDIHTAGSFTYGVYVTGTSQATVNLNNNTLTNTATTGGSIYAYNNATVTVTGSNGSVITGDVLTDSGATIGITLTSEGTALHGNFNQRGPSTINLSIGAGVLLEGSGELDNLTLESGAIIGYAGNVLLVTNSISIGDGITIDFSNLTETGEYTVFDWSGATGGDSINAGQFNVAADTGIEGTFSVADKQLTFNATAVPEPSTWFLIGAGLGVLALIRRRSS